MLYNNDLIETNRSNDELNADVGRVALHSIYVPLQQLTEAGLCDWIAGAQVGQAIQYHEGLLLRDRSESSSGLPTKERARIHSLARRAWIACELGLVHLFSQKVDDDHYRYLAMRSSTTLKPPEIRTQLRIAQSVTTRHKSH